MTEPRHTTLPPIEHEWAKVELYRWQHGVLPGHAELHEPTGLRLMAEMIKSGPINQLPSRFNIAAVLFYVADQLELLDATSKQLLNVTIERNALLAKE